MNGSDSKDPQKRRTSKSISEYAKSGVNLASDSVNSVVKPLGYVARASAKASGKAVKYSGKAVQGTAYALNPTNLFKKSRTKAEKAELYEGLQTDAAEDYLLEGLEAKSRRTIPNGDGFRPAVEGERAPFGLSSLGNAFGDADDEEAPLVTQSAPDYRSMAHMARQQSRKFSHVAAESDSALTTMRRPSPMSGHQRAATLLESINDDGEEDGNDASNKHPAVEEIFPGGPSEIVVDESHPLLVGGEMDFDSPSPAPYLRLQEARRNGRKGRCRRCLECLNPLFLITSLLRMILLPFMLWFLPLFVVSWVLFYYLGNPEIQFLPGEATISWWCNFIVRQAFLLQVSYIAQTILIDWIVMSSRLVLAIIGPWATMLCLQSRGWPFLVGMWGILAMIFLHGDNAFVQHWLHFTGIKIFTVANSGSYILNSSTYLRVLIGMLLAGIATSLKRTIVTLYFGKRSFDLYKDKLEKLLNNVILVSEVAELSAAADEIEGPDSGSRDGTPATSRKSKSHVRWSSLKFEDRQKMRKPQNVAGDLSDSDDDDNDDSEDSGGDSDNNDADEVKVDTKKDKKEESLSDDGDSNIIPPHGGPFTKSYSSLSLDTSVKHFKIKNMLGRWDDPLNKMDSKSQSSVSDILKFRKALTYMDLEHPFSESFGPASTRDELLTSSQTAYSRLKRLSGGSSTLPFQVLAVLVENEDGSIDKQKRRQLKKIFPPDRSGNVSLLAFMMGCDTVYKKLRYFRASVGNSSVIDKVLEDIVDFFFNFILVIMVLSLLNLNPWPLLVSTSTLMVTFAFALGPSAAKAIEGMILIVGRRPYDIGDRIIISNTPGGAVTLPGVAQSWFVEDITLFTTTLRFGANNELATISNGSIAQARITNCARSKKATVHIAIKFHIGFHEGSNLADYREALDTYVLNNPNRWDSIVFFRCEEIDTDNEFVLYSLVLRSTQSWQTSPRVLEFRSNLHRFCLDLAKKMGVNYNSPLPSSVIYTGGVFKDTTNPKINRVRTITESSDVLPSDESESVDDPTHSEEEAKRTALKRSGDD